MISVGNFGGYVGRAIDWRPTRNGLLTMVHDGSPSAFRLLWSYGKSGEVVLGDAHSLSEDDPGAPRSTVHGWTTHEAQDTHTRALVSRAWPAIRLCYSGTRMEWRTSGTVIFGVVDGKPQELTLPVTGLSEPWVVVYGHVEDDDWAVLLTFSRKLASIDKTDDGYAFTFGDGCAMNIMPLDGIQRHSVQPPIEQWVSSAREWVRPLLAFPTSCTETFETTDDGVNVSAKFTHEVLTDDWGNEAVVLAPFPPSVALAATNGYPVRLPEGLVTDSVQLNVPTFYGPFQFVHGEGYTYTLPPAVNNRPPERSHDAWTEPIRKELVRVIDAIGVPGPDYVDANLQVVTFLSNVYGDLDVARQEDVKRFVSAALEGAMTTLYTVTEPFSGQQWATLGKTWRSHFKDDDPPWAKDQERFDSEFYNGQALTALDAAAQVSGFTAQYFKKAKALYAYDQTFFDWATGSVLTHATGDSANVDGVHFSWQGMLAMARMAHRMGDADTENDATYRAARQQAALYAMWHQAEWMKLWDRAIGHTSGGHVAREDVDTTGPIDAFVEEYGSAVLEFKSFWQCTCFLFYANGPLFEFFKKYDLIDRIKKVEYDILPSLHPSWQDGNAIDPHAENGQPSYGTAWTAAHLMVRALLFNEDRAPLFKVYEATKVTTAAKTWYNMQLPQIAGPLLLALLEPRDGL